MCSDGSSRLSLFKPLKWENWNMQKQGFLVLSFFLDKLYHQKKY